MIYILTLVAAAFVGVSFALYRERGDRGHLVWAAGFAALVAVGTAMQ